MPVALSGNEGSDNVRVEGLEPPWIAPPDPKSGMSTNFTTPAYVSSPNLFHCPSTHAIAGRLLIKKGVQIYGYFIRINGFFQKSNESEKVTFLL